MTIQQAENLQREMGQNRYGEAVRFHGPICSQCHQRIGIGELYLPGDGLHGNICEHCDTRHPQAQLSGKIVNRF